jgi:hypothetical protein
MRIDGSLGYFLSAWLVHNSSYRAMMVQPDDSSAPQSDVSIAAPTPVIVLPAKRGYSELLANGLLTPSLLYLYRSYRLPFLTGAHQLQYRPFRKVKVGDLPRLPMNKVVLSDERTTLTISPKALSNMGRRLFRYVLASHINLRGMTEGLLCQR